MKRIILILSFLILSGCSVEYNIKYENDIYSEEFVVESGSNEYCGSELCSSYINDYYDTNISIYYLDSEEELAYSDDLSKYTFYNKELINTGGKNGIKLNYDFNNSSQYSNSYISRKLFNKIIINDNFIKAYDINDLFLNYSYLDKITVSFVTDKYVKSTNSDEEKDGIHYWYIDKDNYKNKVINISFDQEENESNKLIDKGYLTWNSVKYILIIGVVILLIFVSVIYEKVKKSNK